MVTEMAFNIFVFIVFTILWIAFIAVLLLKREMLDNTWQSIRKLPLYKLKAARYQEAAGQAVQAALAYIRAGECEYGKLPTETAPDRAIRENRGWRNTG